MGLALRRSGFMPNTHSYHTVLAIRVHTGHAIFVLQGKQYIHSLWLSPLFLVPSHTDGQSTYNV